MKPKSLEELIKFRRINPHEEIRSFRLPRSRLSLPPYRSRYYQSIRSTPAPAPRSQRVIVKAAYTLTTGGKKKLQAHVRYLLRPNAEIDPKKEPEMFGNSDVKENIHEEKKFWKFIVSPENGEEMDLKEHTREIMNDASKTLREELKWFAVVHNNTDNPHVHIIVRGVTKDKKELIIDPRFIKQGFRDIARNRATQELGYRNAIDQIKSKKEEVTAERLTSIDREMMNRMVNQKEKERRIIRPKDGFELERLKYLTAIGLAEKKDRKSYFIKQNASEELKTLAKRNDILKNIYDDSKIRPTNLTIYKPGMALKDGKIIKIGVVDELYNKPYVLIERNKRHIYIEGRTKAQIQNKINSRLRKKSKRKTPPGKKKQSIQRGIPE